MQSMYFLTEHSNLVNQQISPQQIFHSLLSADPMQFGQEISSLQQAGIQTLHLDVMDNHYVPNLTFGAGIADGIRKHFPDLGIDVHLMTEPVDRMIEQFAKTGVSQISIHANATHHLDRSLTLIRQLGCRVGLALNPADGLDILEYSAHRLDFVLVMTVNPGFGGQSLIAEVIPKIKRLHQTYPKLAIAVDGGVNANNISTLAAAGCSHFVIGSALLNQKNHQDAVRSFCQPYITSQ